MIKELVYLYRKWDFITKTCSICNIDRGGDGRIMICDYCEGEYVMCHPCADNICYYELDENKQYECDECKYKRIRRDIILKGLLDG